MLEFKEKRKRRKWLYSKWVIIALAVILGFGIDAVWNIYQKDEVSKANLDQANKELARLKSRYDTLNEEITRLQTSAGVEEEIRNKFSVVKAGEQVAIIVDSAPVATSTPAAPVSKTMWQKFLDLF